MCSPAGEGDQVGRVSSRFGSFRTSARTLSLTVTRPRVLLLDASCCYPSSGILRECRRGKHRPADGAMNGFITVIWLTATSASPPGQRIHQHFLGEYLRHVREAAGTVDISVRELMDPRAAAWLADTADGKTRTRNTLGGPDAAASPFDARAHRLVQRLRRIPLPAQPLRPPPPAAGDYLAPAVPSASCTTLPSAGPSTPTPPRRSAPPLRRARRRHRPERPRTRPAHRQRPAPGGRGARRSRRRLLPVSATPTVQILNRWLDIGAAIVAELEGRTLATCRFRPSRGGPGAPSACRAGSLARSHPHPPRRPPDPRRQVRGSPLRPGAFRAVRPSTFPPRPGS